MSSTETHFGKIKVHTRNTESTLNFIKENGLEDKFDITPPGNPTWRTWWSIDPKDEVEDKYIVLRGQTEETKDQLCLCEFLEHAEWGEDDDTSYIKEEDKNTYSFITEFYNGGTCLPEVLEYLLKL